MSSLVDRHPYLLGGDFLLRQACRSPDLVQQGSRTCGTSFNGLVSYHVWRVTYNNMLEDQALDRAYAALADPTRRALLVALREGESRVTDLARPLPMTFAGVSRHIGVLEAAGLVQRTVRGRNHWLSLQPGALDLAQQWIAEQAASWSSRADALAARLERKRSGA
jgi:DNA-binding transcriptional ArsR family regulator